MGGEWTITHRSDVSRRVGVVTPGGSQQSDGSSGSSKLLHARCLRFGDGWARANAIHDEEEHRCEHDYYRNPLIEPESTELVRRIDPQPLDPEAPGEVAREIHDEQPTGP